jgi:lysyl-tRNA synthetase class I
VKCTEPIHPHCPGCGRVARVLLWGVDPSTAAREYRCADCGKRWQVDGVQAELFSADTAVGQLELR